MFFHAYLEQQLVWVQGFPPSGPVFIGWLQQTPDLGPHRRLPLVCAQWWCELGWGYKAVGGVRLGVVEGGLVLAYESCSVEAEVGASLRDPRRSQRGGPQVQLPQRELTVQFRRAHTYAG